MHTSVSLEMPCEIINILPMNPLISKCQIKVCYVSDEPNRNRSVITKEVARKMANSLPGSPVVGYYNEETGDFEEHNRELEIKDGKINFKDTTRPYGFVDLNAKVWFQKFLDDGENVREYLMTEGYIWTGQYPESKRIIEKGNNQSMELDNNLIDASWTKDNNGKPKFFIINEAIISKLCVLGEDYEPCFEGASVTSADETKLHFSFDDRFYTEISSMRDELKLFLNKNKGGTQMFTVYSVKVGDNLWCALFNKVNETHDIIGVFEDNEQKYTILQSKEDQKYYRLNFSLNESDEVAFEEEMTEVEYTLTEESQFAQDEIDSFVENFKKKDEENQDKDDKSDTSNSDNKSEDEKSSESDAENSKDESEGKEDEEDEKKKKKYSLEEIPEYTELQTKYAELETKYNALVADTDKLNEQIKELSSFKLATEKKDKEAMIEKFYMLSDEDKKDVIANIDNYSVEQIEEKLSVICVRNKVSFNLDDDNNDEQDPTVYNLGGSIGDVTPAWIKAAMEVAKEMK